MKNDKNLTVEDVKRFQKIANEEHGCKISLNDAVRILREFETFDEQIIYAKKLGQPC